MAVHWKYNELGVLPWTGDNSRSIENSSSNCNNNTKNTTTTTLYQQQQQQQQQHGQQQKPACSIYHIEGTWDFSPLCPPPSQTPNSRQRDSRSVSALSTGSARPRDGLRKRVVKDCGCDFRGHAVKGSCWLNHAGRKGKRRVTIHATFLKVGEVNTLKEQFDADILIRTRWREPELDGKSQSDHPILNNLWGPKIIIENSIGDPKTTFSRTLDMTDSGDAYVIERRRMRGTFMETLELWHFPFDVQDLTVNVMSDLPSTEVELMEDPDEIHKIYKQSFIDEQEWYLYKYIESETRELAKDRADPTIRRSVLTVRCRAARRPGYFIWNIFSVTFLISIMSFLTFAVPPSLPQNRLQLAFTLVLTAVAFKFVVNQSLPRISYLTYLDRYVLATMLTLVSTCIWHGMQTAIPAATEKDYVALIILMLIYLIYNVQFVLKILLVPYKTRRMMKRLEAEYVSKVPSRDGAGQIYQRLQTNQPGSSGASRA